MMKKALISVVGTGGTIAGRAEDTLRGSDYRAGVEGVDSLLSGLGLEDVVILRTVQVASVGSEDMTDDVWVKLARVVEEETLCPDVDGVVVVHGTDTMEETACFLDLLVSSPKPVVVTGSMRPANVAGADGPGNLSAAIRLAASERGRMRGVLVLFSDQIFAARDVVKVDAMLMDAFAAPGFGPLGRMVDGEPLWFRSRRADMGGMVRITLPESGILPRVEIVYGHAGQRPEMVLSALSAGAKGIVHAGVGAGNIHKDVKPFLLEASEKGTAVVVTSRCSSGPVPFKGEGKLIYSCGLNPQKARTVLQLALCATTDPMEIQTLFTSYMTEDQAYG